MLFTASQDRNSFLEIQCGLIYQNARTHSGRQHHFLDVGSLGRGWFGLFQISQQCLKVTLDCTGIKTDFADPAMDDAVLVSSVTNLTCLGIFLRQFQHPALQYQPSG